MSDSLKKFDTLFDRLVSILEQARTNIVKSVNQNTILAYWFTGREIVEEIQKGEERAEYGKQIIETLSKQLTEQYGKGFLVTSLNISEHFIRPIQIVWGQQVASQATNLISL